MAARGFPSFILAMNKTAAAFVFYLLLLSAGCHDAKKNDASAAPNTRAFDAEGVIREINAGAKTVVIQHRAISNYMDSMTMPFKVKDPAELAQFAAGDQVKFQLRVGPDESWIEHLVKTGHADVPPLTNAAPPVPTNAAAAFKLSDIPELALTNQFGQPFSFRQFKGQAVALTFFFTRCPIPEYCPRLSKSFQNAGIKIKATPNAPTNWHLISISFDPLDTPGMLKNYAERYQYDSNHWSFVTGKPEHIQALTRGFGLPVTPEAGLFVHDFRTAIFDASGRLQTMWPFAGDMSDALASELIKGAGVTNL